MSRILFTLIIIFSPSTNAAVINLTTTTQIKMELVKPGPKVLLYYTDWCPSCQEFKPTYKRLSNSIPNVKFYSMNSDKVRLKEHNFSYIPYMYVGKSSDDLRNHPCIDLNSVERTIPILKQTIRECLNK